MKLGISTSERGELAAARRRIRELETELALVKQEAALFEEGVRPKDTSPVIAELAGQGFAAKQCSGSLGRALRPDPYTYLRAGTSWLYLATVVDLYSRRLVGWSLATHLRAELVIDALDAAVTTRGRAEGVVFHADHGAQCTSAAFAQVCATHKVVQSMGRIGDSYDSAVAESFFATLKRELGGRFDSADHAWRCSPGSRSQPPPATLRPRLPQPDRVREHHHTPAARRCMKSGVRIFGGPPTLLLA